MTSLMQLEDARAIAKEVLHLIAPYCERAEIAGSIRRKKQGGIKDVEIVVKPKFADGSLGLFGPQKYNVLHVAMESFLTNGIIEHGLLRGPQGNISAPFSERYYNFRYRGNPVDLFSCIEPAQWGVIFLVRTGCSVFSQSFVTRLWKWNLHCIDGHLERTGYGTCPTPEEKDAFYLSDLKYLEPEARSMLSNESTEAAKRRWGFS